MEGKLHCRYFGVIVKSNLRVSILAYRLIKDMENVREIRRENPRSWCITLASLFPLWSISFAVMAEGFPRPPISVELAKFAFILAVVVSILLLWKRWMTVELVFYSHLPFYLLYAFDEISTTYKTPFIVLCTLI